MVVHVVPSPLACTLTRVRNVYRMYILIQLRIDIMQHLWSSRDLAAVLCVHWVANERKGVDRREDVVFLSTKYFTVFTTQRARNHAHMALDSSTVLV